MDKATVLDGAWLRANPLPQPDEEADKNARGRVLVIGGSRIVPGGVRLTAEAALRAGAGKVQVATVDTAAAMIGGFLPEIAVVPLATNADGEIDAAQVRLEAFIARSDAVVLGPAMGCAEQGTALVEVVLEQGADVGLVLDAAALMAIGGHAQGLVARASPAVLTPHIGEIAALLECDADLIDRDRESAVRKCAQRFGAVVVLKGAVSVVGDPTGAVFTYSGGNVGLATGGSGDVMAGIAGALIARGAPPLTAALWSVWLHGEAGRRCAESIGPLGFLASELLGFIPQVMHRAG
ncbi:MAG: NAD(P)H-hydrate dehydratase [Novosphingobium sp.]|nr:NAD(P)H-hydrate dehydratase [Novosphingobium sp.]